MRRFFLRRANIVLLIKLYYSRPRRERARMINASHPPTTTTATGTKRKRIGKYYAVRTGHKPGIYTSWSECLDQVRGFKGSKFKSFSTTEEATLFLKGEDPSLNPASDSYVAKFYGVRSGKVPGVYTDWVTAEQQVIGVLKPKVRCFHTREEAEAFVESGRTTQLATGDPPSTEPAPKKRRSLGTSLSEKDLNESSAPAAVKAEPTSPSHPTKKRRDSTSSVLRIYTDGSALGNGKSNASAGVGVWFGDHDPKNISEPLQGPRQTNQRAELTAILRAIDVAPLHRDVLIFTDSKYAINCVTMWHITWSRKNWMNSQGKSVENQDLVEAVLDKLKEREEYGSKTSFEWVKGHTGNDDGNSQADRLAVEGAKMARS